MRAVLVVFFAIYGFAHGLNIPDNGASGRSPSLDPCSQVPCGQNAMCDVTPGGIAYCHCSPGHVGDPFAGCKSTEGSNPSTSTTFNIPQTNLGGSKNDASPNPNPPRFTVEFVESSSTDGGTNSNRRLPILASEASMEPQESHKRVEGVEMQSSSAIVHESVVQSQETRRRPSLPSVVTTSDMYPQVPLPIPQTFEHPPPPHHLSGSEVTDPMGQYSNCRTINNAIVCADTSNFVEGSGGRHQPPKQHVEEYPHHHPASILISKLGSPGGGGGSHQDDICRGRCGVDEICRVVNNGPVCGSKGSSSSNAKDTSSSYCQKHVDCPTSQVCSQHTCVDPCTTTPSEGGGDERLVCGGNARCIVIQHSPLCGCNEGLKGNPYVACS